MSRGERKHEGIDLLKLYACHKAAEWNAFLWKCESTDNLSLVLATMYRMQVGMTDVAKKKLGSEKIDLWFIRIQRSLENTAKKIWRRRYPNPCDNPLIAMKNLEFKEEKKKRDLEFQELLKKARF